MNGLEIHTAISPTTAFLRQVHYLAESLRQFDHSLAASSIVVTVGEDCEPYDLARNNPWASVYSIQFNWVPRPLFQKYGYFATAIQRYLYPFHEPTVLFLDADLIINGNWSELLNRVATEPALYGMPAHSSPWQNTNLLHIRSDAEWWRTLFAEAGLGEPPMVCRYTGYGILYDPTLPRECPPYFNQGVLAAPAGIMQEIGSCIFQELDLVNRLVETPYKVQIALTLALLRKGLPWRTLPLRYNFTPGFRAYIEALPEEWEHAKVLHYSCTPQLDKDRLMSSPSEMSAWLSEATQDPAAERLRKAFAALHPAILAAEAASRSDGSANSTFALLDNQQIAAVHDRMPALAADRPVESSYPFAVFNIEITNHCPLRCIMCARTNDMTRPQGHMTFNLFRKIIDELTLCNPTWSESVPVRLHGFGESLVHPDFDKFIRYAENNGVRTCLSVNPLVLTEGVRARLLAAEPSLLYISLDGHDDETFEQIRGVRKAYDRSKANLLAFLAQKRERPSRSKIVVSMIDFPQNEESIRECEDYWSTLEGIDEFRRKSFSTWDGNSTGVNKLAGISPAAAPRHIKASCRWPWTAMTILWDGDVVPCCNDFDKRYVLGNLNAESLPSIWNGARMRALRAELASGVVANDLCRNCSNL